MLRRHNRGIGKPLLKGRENLDSLDRIDSEVGVEPHLGFEHFHGVSRLLGHNFVKHASSTVAHARGLSSRCDRTRIQERDDVAESEKCTELLRGYGRSFGKGFLESGEDLDSLDRIDSEVGVEPHVGFEHLGGIPRLFRDNAQQNVCHSVPRAITGGLSQRRFVRTQEGEDIAKRVKGAEMLGFDDRCTRKAFLKGREDFDAFDRIDSEVGVEPHVGFEHLGWITGLLGDDLHKRCRCLIAGGRLGAGGATMS